MSKALETVKLIEITLVLSVETYGGNSDHISAIDYLTTHSDAELIGWSERELIAIEKPETTNDKRH